MADNKATTTAPTAAERARLPGPYPRTPPTHGMVVFTAYGHLHHLNEVPRARAADALERALKIAGGFSGAAGQLGAALALLSDVPAEPLLSRDQQRKGSVLGLVSIGYAMVHGSDGARVRRMLDAGDGVVILRISGSIEAPAGIIELFETWQEYQSFLAPHIRAGTLVPGEKASTLI